VSKSAGLLLQLVEGGRHLQLVTNPTAEQLISLGPHPKTQPHTSSVSHTPLLSNDCNHTAVTLPKAANSLARAGLSACEQSLWNKRS